MWALVVLFGLYHGLVFLPVALSLIGPAAEDESPEEDNDDFVGHLNWAFDGETNEKL